MVQGQELSPQNHLTPDQLSIDIALLFGSNSHPAAIELLSLLATNMKEGGVRLTFDPQTGEVTDIASVATTASPQTLPSSATKPVDGIKSEGDVETAPKLSSQGANNQEAPASSPVVKSSDAALAAETPKGEPMQDLESKKPFFTTPKPGENSKRVDRARESDKATRKQFAEMDKAGKKLLAEKSTPRPGTSRRRFLKMFLGTLAAVTVGEGIHLALNKDHREDMRELLREIYQSAYSVVVREVEQGSIATPTQAQEAFVETATEEATKRGVTLNPTLIPTVFEEGKHPFTATPEASATEEVKFSGTEPITDTLIKKYPAYFRELPWMDNTASEQKFATFAQACADAGYSNLLFDYGLRGITMEKDEKKYVFKTGWGNKKDVSGSTDQSDFDEGIFEMAGSISSMSDRTLNVQLEKSAKQVKSEKYESGKQGAQLTLLVGANREKKVKFADYVRNDSKLQDIMIALILDRYPELKGKHIVVEVGNYVMEDVVPEDLANMDLEAYTNKTAIAGTDQSQYFFQARMAVSDTLNEGKPHLSVLNGLGHIFYMKIDGAKEPNRASTQLPSDILWAVYNESGSPEYPIEAQK